MISLFSANLQLCGHHLMEWDQRAGLWHHQVGFSEIDILNHVNNTVVPGLAPPPKKERMIPLVELSTERERRGEEKKGTEKARQSAK